MPLAAERDAIAAERKRRSSFGSPSAPAAAGRGGVGAAAAALAGAEAAEARREVEAEREAVEAERRVLALERTALTQERAAVAEARDALESGRAAVESERAAVASERQQTQQVEETLLAQVLAPPAATHGRPSRPPIAAPSSHAPRHRPPPQVASRMSLIAEREVKFADIEAGFHDKLARLPKQIAAAQHWVDARAGGAALPADVGARSLKLNAMANAVLKDRKQFLVLMQRGAKESAPADDLPPPPRAVQRLTSEPVVKGRDADWRSFITERSTVHTFTRRVHRARRHAAGVLVHRAEALRRARRGCGGRAGGPSA